LLLANLVILLLLLSSLLIIVYKLLSIDKQWHYFARETISERGNL